MFHPTTNMSNVWRGITDITQWLKKGSAVAIGNGRSTLFWDHCWAEDNTLQSVAMEPIPSSIEGAIVEDMWDPNLGWNLEVGSLRSCPTSRKSSKNSFTQTGK